MGAWHLSQVMRAQVIARSSCPQRERRKDITDIDRLEGKNLGDMHVNA